MKQKTPIIIPHLVMGLLFVGIYFSASPQAFAKKYVMASVPECAAFKQFQMRPVSHLSKLLYLIDRFGTLDIQVRYDGHDYSAAFVARLAKWFLARNYNKQEPREWVMRWCNTSIGGQLIWVRMPNGSYRLAREILLEELDALEKAMIESAKTPTAQDSSLAVSAISPLSVTAPANAAQ